MSNKEMTTGGQAGSTLEKQRTRRRRAEGGRKQTKLNGKDQLDSAMSCSAPEKWRVPNYRPITIQVRNMLNIGKNAKAELRIKKYGSHDEIHSIMHCVVIKHLANLSV